MNTIKNNIDHVNSKIRKKSEECGRNKSEITLIAVSKFQSVETINEARKYGIIDFGENKAQELRQKFSVLSQEINWHFIGHLQTNKVKIVVPSAKIIHSVDSIKIVNEINKRAAGIEKIQAIFLEVKTSDEESKYGINSFESLIKVVDHCFNLSNINLDGLMTMAPFTKDVNVIRNSFRKLANYKLKLIEKGFNLRHLSMGMTNDYEIAIEEGATMLRIGTAIFGERDYLIN